MLTLSSDEIDAEGTAPQVLPPSASAVAKKNPQKEAASETPMVEAYRRLQRMRRASARKKDTKPRPHFLRVM
jgi:hypothetical protein